MGARLILGGMIVPLEKIATLLDVCAVDGGIENSRIEQAKSMHIGIFVFLFFNRFPAPMFQIQSIKVYLLQYIFIFYYLYV
jgi:hypothetical protein